MVVIVSDSSSLADKAIVSKMGDVVDNDNMHKTEGPVSSSQPCLKRKRSVQLLGKVLHDPKYYEYKVYMEMAVKDIKKAWRGNIYAKDYSVKVIDVEEGLLRFTFKNPVDKDWVMDERPWVLDWQHFLLVLEEWCPSVPASLITVDSCPFWIQAVVPVELMSKELGFDIGKVFGSEPLEVDEFSEIEGETPNILSIRVMVNVAKRVIGGCWLALPKNEEDVDGDDKLLWVTFEYEELPCMCYLCGMIGHYAGRCVALAGHCEEGCNVLNRGNVMINYNGGEDEKPVVSEGDILIDRRKIAYESWLDESGLDEIQSYRDLKGSPKWDREGKIVVATNWSKTSGVAVNDENMISVVLHPKP